MMKLRGEREGGWEKPIQFVEFPCVNGHVSGDRHLLVTLAGATCAQIANATLSNHKMRMDNPDWLQSSPPKSPPQKSPSGPRHALPFVISWRGIDTRHTPAPTGEMIFTTSFKLYPKFRSSENKILVGPGV